MFLSDGVVVFVIDCSETIKELEVARKDLHLDKNGELRIDQLSGQCFFPHFRISKNFRHRRKLLDIYLQILNMF